jgi:predicted RNase H-like nuclease (RuvC/YqgF family)
MQTWLTLEEFCKFSGKSEKEVLFACKKKELKCKKSEGVIYIEMESLANALVPVEELEVIEKQDDIAQRTIGMLLTLHEKVLMSKDETIEALKEENRFLKDSIYSIQEVYEDSQKTIERLQKQLEICQDELEFCKRKYKLMWGKVLKKEDEKEGE